jgi:hypothetical protein
MLVLLSIGTFVAMRIVKLLEEIVRSILQLHSNPIAVFPHMISLISASNTMSFPLNPFLKLRHTC